MAINSTRKFTFYITAFLIISLTGCKTDTINIEEKPAQDAAEAVDRLITAGKWQIKEGFINEIKVIEDGKSLTKEVDFEIADQITWIQFKETGEVEMYFGEKDQSLTMNYEISKDGQSIRIFQKFAIQDFLKRENWIITAGSVYSDRFEMSFSDKISGIDVVTRLVMVVI
ncbi:hypothetical protein SAMN06298216_2604 [Spirosomataceae bacterium TFI 002]|nr:hypothetical protein SAMN06298216_2604 [Spirosomataceae bacterium TFI 002]